jgi:hypothetical protein
MKTFQQFLEGADPNEANLSGGQGDNPDLAGAKPANDRHQISDHLKKQLSNTTQYLEKIKPHEQMKIPQNSNNIPAHKPTVKAPQ